MLEWEFLVQIDFFFDLNNTKMVKKILTII